MQSMFIIRHIEPEIVILDFSLKNCKKLLSYKRENRLCINVCSSTIVNLKRIIILRGLIQNVVSHWLDGLLNSIMYHNNLLFVKAEEVISDAKKMFKPFIKRLRNRFKPYKDMFSEIYSKHVITTEITASVELTCLL